VEEVWTLLRRHGWSCQVPVRQAIERDEAAIAMWKAEVWPEIKAPPATWAPTSVSRTRPGRGCGRRRDAPELNPAEGIWPLLKRTMANFAAADVDSLARIIKRKLKKIQYRPT
jgi:hypothetical protein